MQTLGWSPDRLAAITWTVGGMLGGLAAVLAAPLTGLSAITFTVVVTVAGLGAALLGGFQSFPLTLLGGLIIGVGEAMATLYGGDITDFFHQDQITGLSRMPAFLVIFVVVVVRGAACPSARTSPNGCRSSGAARSTSWAWSSRRRSPSPCSSR